MKKLVLIMALSAAGFLRADVKPYSVVLEKYCGHIKGDIPLTVCVTERSKTKVAYLSLGSDDKVKRFAPAQESAILGEVGGRVYTGTIVFPRGRNSYDLERTFVLRAQGEKVRLTLTHDEKENVLLTDEFEVMDWEEQVHTAVE